MRACKCQCLAIHGIWFYCSFGSLVCTFRSPTLHRKTKGGKITWASIARCSGGPNSMKIRIHLRLFVCSFRTFIFTRARQLLHSTAFFQFLSLVRACEWMSVGWSVTIFVCAFNFGCLLPIPASAVARARCTNFGKWWMRTRARDGTPNTYCSQFPVGVRLRFTNYLWRHTYAIRRPLCARLLIFIVVNSTFTMGNLRGGSTKLDFFLGFGSVNGEKASVGR